MWKSVGSPQRACVFVTSIGMPRAAQTLLKLTPAAIDHHERLVRTRSPERRSPRRGSLVRLAVASGRTNSRASAPAPRRAAAARRSRTGPSPCGSPFGMPRRTGSRILASAPGGPTGPQSSADGHVAARGHHRHQGPGVSTASRPAPEGVGGPSRLDHPLGRVEEQLLGDVLGLPGPALEEQRRDAIGRDAEASVKSRA